MKEIVFLLLAFHGTPQQAQLVQREVESFYQVKMKVLVDKEISSSAYVAARNRYSSGKILEFLLHHHVKEGREVLALTSKEIAMTKKSPADWRILGRSLQGHHCSVVSTYRIKSPELLAKVAIHEFGHGRGLPHCSSNQPCVMKDAQGKASVISNQPKALCSKCKTQLNNLRQKNEIAPLNSNRFFDFFRSLF
jgi:predicted Zn-dependent protease